MEILVTGLFLILFILCILYFDLNLKINKVKSRMDQIERSNSIKEEVNILNLNVMKMKKLIQFEQRGGGAPQPSEPPPKPKGG